VTVAPADLLANAEREPSDRPLASADEGSIAGYWLGSAGGEVQRWRARALRAEAELARLLGRRGDP
jgi:hypothetical protein